jgi:predicted nucleic acid-binding protein
VIVVADTSPLNYLVLIGHVEILHQLYGRVVIPAGVAAELRDSRSPEAVRTWASAPPDWLEVRSVEVPADAGLDAVDSGEAEAIVLAEGNRPDVLLIIDDRDGRREAARRGIATTGTLGVLNDAAGRDLIDLADALSRLDKTTFRASPALLRELLERERQRRKKPLGP